MRRRLLLIIALIGFVGCTSPNATDEEMYSLAAALTKLSSAVEGVVRYENAHIGLTDRELLEATTAHDPSLLRPFAEHRLRARVHDRHAVVLVCDKERGHALLEDAGCSGKLDVHHWKADQPKPCEFSLRIEVACSL